MRITAVIPARSGSRRVPLKNFYSIGGVTLLERAVRFAKAFDFEEIIVTSDSSIAEDVANAEGVTFNRRPKELSLGEPGAIVNTWTDALAGRDWEVSVLLEPSSPLRRPDDLTACLDLIGLAQTVFTVSPLIGDKAYRPNGLIYAIKGFDPGERESIYGNPSVAVITQRPVINIDTHHDLELAEWMIFNEEGP